MSPFKIKFNLSKIEAFEIRYTGFDVLYMKIKTEGYDDFRMKMIEKQTDEEKYDSNTQKSGIVLSKIKSKIINDVNIYDRVKNDNYYLVSGGDIYELLQSYFLEVERTIYEAVKKEYQVLLKDKKLK